jgi:hypothetical protein
VTEVRLDRRACVAGQHHHGACDLPDAELQPESAGTGQHGGRLAGPIELSLRPDGLGAAVFGLPVPVSAVLDEVGICPWDRLAKAVAYFGGPGVSINAILQSWAQGVKVWGENGMEMLFGATTVTVFGAGLNDERLLRHISQAVGRADVVQHSTTRGSGGRSDTTSTDHREILPPDSVRAMPKGTALVLATGRRPVMVRLLPWYETSYRDVVQQSLEETRVELAERLRLTGRDAGWIGQEEAAATGVAARRAGEVAGDHAVPGLLAATWPSGDALVGPRGGLGSLRRLPPGVAGAGRRARHRPVGLAPRPPRPDAQGVVGGEQAVRRVHTALARRPDAGSTRPATLVRRRTDSAGTFLTLAPAVNRSALAPRLRDTVLVPPSGLPPKALDGTKDRFVRSKNSR